jgi:hypothetical protein
VHEGAVLDEAAVSFAMLVTLEVFCCKSEPLQNIVFHYFATMRTVECDQGTKEPNLCVLLKFSTIGLVQCIY